MSLRYKSSYYHRRFLDNAIESDMQTEEEIEYLRKYKKTLHALKREEKELSRIRKRISEMSHEEGATNTPELEDSRESEEDISTLISHYKKYLFKLETTSPLRDVIERELRKQEAAMMLLNEQKSLQNEEPSVESAQAVSEPKEAEPPKEKFLNTLGAFGAILIFLSRCIIAILPFVMIEGNFFLTLLLIAINTFVPFASIVFWVWGLVCAIQGVQDFWAILYYISFVVIWLPFFIRTVVSVFSKD